MFRTALVTAAATATIMVGPGLSAQTLGIAACDDFLKKYETCVTSQVPAAQRANFQGQFDQWRKAWLYGVSDDEFVARPSVRPGSMRRDARGRA